MSKINIKKIVFGSFLAIVVTCALGIQISSAETPASLPKMLVGSSKITTGGVTYNGGMQGNYSVLNYGDPGNFGMNADGSLESCMDSNIIVMPICFALSNGTSNAVRLLTSRTSFTIGSQTATILESPALMYGSGTIIGDTFGLDSNLFDYWGKNLAGSGGNLSYDSGASWKLKNYALNPNAQMAWDGTDNNPQFSQFDQKLQNLAASAATLTSDDLNNRDLWNLCGTTVADAYTPASPTVSGSCANYPEGKTWVIDGDLTLTTSGNRTIQFQGVGTIIVNGNIYVNKNVSIQPIDKMTDKVGFIAQ